MAYNQKETAGRGNMPKTGRGIPTNMTNPINQNDPKSGKNQNVDFSTDFSIDPNFGSRYKKKKVGRDVVRKKNIMDSDVGKDAMKTVAKGAKGLSSVDVSPKRVAGTFKETLPVAGKAKVDYGDKFSDTAKTYHYGQSQGFKTGGRASEALGKMGAKAYEAKYGKGSL